MIGIEIEKQDQFREQSVPILSQIEEQEIEAAYKSDRGHMFPQSPVRFSTGAYLKSARIGVGVTHLFVRMQ